jgi:hypothetical protein
MRGCAPGSMGGCAAGGLFVGMQGQPAGAGGRMREGGVGFRQQSRRDKGAGEKNHRKHENHDWGSAHERGYGESRATSV